MINSLIPFIRGTQSTVYDTESLTILESIAKVIEKVNESIKEFNSLETKTTNDYNNFLNQIKKYKEYCENQINSYHNEVVEIVDEFKRLIKALNEIENTIEYVEKQSKYVQDLAKKNQDAIDKGTIVTKDEIISYPKLSFEENIQNVNIKYPYGYIERYGGNNSGEVDNSAALQNTINFIEWSNKTQGKIYPIKFSSGKYLFTKPVFIKCGKSQYEEFSTPITIEGVGGKYLSARNSTLTINGVDGTLLIFDIDDKNKNGILINNSYDENGNDLNTMINSTNIVNNLTIRNLAFTTTNGGGNVIKGYRFRTNMSNIYCDNFDRLIYQPINDKHGKYSYCDFSNYENINFNRIGITGLELSVCDNTSIERITNHSLKATFKSVIKIFGGGGIELNHIHSAYHFVDGSLNPRQDGTGKYGTKAIIDLTQTTGVKIQNVYVERPLADYFLIINNCSNVILDNYYERYLGNGLLRIRNKCKNIEVSNIYRDSNIITDYDDIFSDSHDYESLTIKNFKANDYYSNILTLTSQLTDLTKNEEKPKRYLKFNANQIDNSRLSMDILTLKLEVSEGNIVVKNLDGSISKIVNAQWEENKISISSITDKLPLFLQSVNIKFQNETIKPLIPLLSFVENGKVTYIRFFSLETMGYTSNVSDKICLILNFKTVV